MYNHNRSIKSRAENETEQQKLVQELFIYNKKTHTRSGKGLGGKRTTITWAGRGAGNRTTTTQN
jgi:hypothetical protein